ncbi:MAG TPA: exonuclease domain-containing protein [Kiritimatiellia bacterium]|nr:exonuclease domain-containing protein [Kiritimatiellia bacterium]
MLARESVLVAIDFETTGVVSGFGDDPWQIGMVRLRGGRVMMEETYERLLGVGDRPFNPMAPGQHHRLREALRTAPRLEELWHEVESWWVGGALVAHNAAVERRVVNRVAPLHGIGPWIDTLALARRVYPGLASHKLEDVLVGLGLMARVCDVCPGRTVHDALFDAVGCGMILEHILLLPGWREAEVEDLAGKGGA